MGNLDKLSPEEQIELLALLELDERERIDKQCSRRVVSHKAGPMYWLRNWTKTENKQWEAQGLLPKMPFPYKPHELSRKGWDEVLASLPFEHDFTPEDPPDYLDIVAGYWISSNDLYIPKTREMLTSWVICGLITWHCQFNDSIQWLSQSEDDLKAQGLIEYANILYSNQEDWMRARHPLKRGDAGTMHKIEWANGSSYLALPSGERKLASHHPHGYFSDESAHQKAWKSTLNIAKPAVRQIVCVSSVAPGDFWNECNEAL